MIALQNTPAAWSLLLVFRSTCFATSLLSLQSDGVSRNGTYISPTLTVSSTSASGSTSSLQTTTDTSSSSSAILSSSFSISSTFSSADTTINSSSPVSSTSNSLNSTINSDSPISSTVDQNNVTVTSISFEHISISSTRANLRNISTTATLSNSNSSSWTNTSTGASWSRNNSTSTHTGKPVTFPVPDSLSLVPSANGSRVGYVPGYADNVFMDITYTGGPFPTSCPQAISAGIETLKNPKLNPWKVDSNSFKPWKDSNPCLYHWCRAQLVSKFPEDGRGNFSRITSGCFPQQRLWTETSTLENGGVTSFVSDILTSWCKKTTTMSGWPKRFGGLWGPPCCDVCYVTAGTAQIKYWPPSTPGQPDPLIITEDGKTYTSPSLYVTFNTVEANDLCSEVGEDRHWPVLSFAPDEVRQIRPNRHAVHGWGGPGSAYDNMEMDWASYYTYMHESCHKNSYNITETYDPKKNLRFSDYDPCSPRIGLPHGWAGRIDPRWSTCKSWTIYQGFLDPPHALTPYPGLIIPPSRFDNDDDSTSPPEVSATITQSSPAYTEPAAPGTRVLPPVQSPSLSPSSSPTPGNDQGGSPDLDEPGRNDREDTVPDPSSPEQSPTAASPNPAFPNPASPTPESSLPQQSVIMTSMWSDLGPILQDNWNVIVKGQTLTPGQGTVVVSGMTMIMGTDGALYAGNTLLGSFPVASDAPDQIQGGSFGNSNDDTLGDDGGSGGEASSSWSMGMADFIISAIGGSVREETSAVTGTETSRPTVSAETASSTGEALGSVAGTSSSVEGNTSPSRGSGQSTETSMETSIVAPPNSPNRGSGESTETSTVAPPNSGAVFGKMAFGWAWVCMAALYVAF